MPKLLPLEYVIKRCGHPENWPLHGTLCSQSGISKSQVSRVCQEIDAQVQTFLSRPLESSGYAYLYLNATYLHGVYTTPRDAAHERS